MFLLNMSLEISNIYSLLLYRYLFWYFLGGGRGEGGINFSADCLGGSENLYGPWGGGYKKTSRWKKNPLPPPVAYIMNAALPFTTQHPAYFTRFCEKGPGNGRILANGKSISRILFRTEKEDYLWRLSTISEKIFRKIAFPFDLKPKFPDFLAKW